ncbi:MAG: hypothetical protein DSY50_05745 [Desulfobulbus sp.]|nr:MAG: hypothetical protein DSY50_05745 [Desulfobulbus sp.]
MKTNNQHPQEPPHNQGNRFLTLMLIGGVFIIIDLIILLYFFWPGKEHSTLPGQQPQVPAVENHVKTPYTPELPGKKE